MEIFRVLDFFCFWNGNGKAVSAQLDDGFSQQIDKKKIVYRPKWLTQNFTYVYMYVYMYM